VVARVRTAKKARRDELESRNKWCGEQGSVGGPWGDSPGMESSAPYKNSSRLVEKGKRKNITYQGPWGCQKIIRVSLLHLSVDL
jgi:hypothetical protein